MEILISRIYNKSIKIYLSKIPILLEELFSIIELSKIIEFF